jgi:predicted xylose isomerase-like sugar epimerase
MKHIFLVTLLLVLPLTLFGQAKPKVQVLAPLPQKAVTQTTPKKTPAEVYKITEKQYSILWEMSVKQGQIRQMTEKEYKTILTINAMYMIPLWKKEVQQAQRIKDLEKQVSELKADLKQDLILTPIKK